MSSSDCAMKRLCALYIRRVTIIGALYCAVPTVLWFAGTFALIPFRGVYVLRLALSLLAGCALSAYVNRFGLSLWLIKHRSSAGPATVVDGVLIGAAVGWGSDFLPPVTSLIGTNHPEEAKAFIIIAWLVAALIGAIIGGSLAAIGRKHLDRTVPAQPE